MLKRFYLMFVNQTYWRAGLGSLGVLFKPLIVTNPRCIRIADYSQIRDFARLEVIHGPHLDWSANESVSNVSVSAMPSRGEPK
jgi:hypothetical protein